MKTSVILQTSAVMLCTVLLACNPQQNNKSKQDNTTEMVGGKIKLGRACRADIKQYCASAEKGKPRRECLENNIDKLSADCKTALEQRKKHRGGKKFKNKQDNDDSD